MSNFRVWREKEKKFDYYEVGQDAALNAGDVVQLGSGVLDNNGTEVFDGDIVDGDGRGRKDKVVFSCGCFCLSEAMMHYEATYWGNEIRVLGHIFDGESDL